jgi:hypothetical protein
LAVAVILCMPLRAQDKHNEEAGKQEEPQRVALYCFYDNKLHEHVYTYGDGELAAWRKNRDMKSCRRR